MSLRLTRRIQALERALPSRPHPDRINGEMVQAALGLISYEDRLVLRGATQEELKADGPLSPESDAVCRQAEHAFARAIAQVQSAGALCD